MGAPRGVLANAEWLDAGLLAVPVAVNISSLEFRSRPVSRGIQGALKNARLDPDISNSN